MTKLVKLGLKIIRPVDPVVLIKFLNDSIQINSLHSTDSDIDVGILENLGIVEEDMPVPVVCQGNTMLSEQERQERLRKQEDESPW